MARTEQSTDVRHVSSSDYVTMYQHKPSVIYIAVATLPALYDDKWSCLWLRSRIEGIQFRYPILFLTNKSQIKDSSDFLEQVGFAEVTDQELKYSATL